MKNKLREKTDEEIYVLLPYESPRVSPFVPATVLKPAAFLNNQKSIYGQGIPTALMQELI